jgi:hypothetical protein
VELLINVLREERNGMHNSILGDHAPVMDLINPFSDHGGAHRMGVYLKSYIEAFSRGFSLDESLLIATCNYQSVFGKWSATTILADKNESFYDAELLA